MSDDQAPAHTEQRDTNSHSKRYWCPDCGTMLSHIPATLNFNKQDEIDSGRFFHGPRLICYTCNKVVIG